MFWTTISSRRSRSRFFSSRRTLAGRCAEAALAATVVELEAGDLLHHIQGSIRLVALEKCGRVIDHALLILTVIWRRCFLFLSPQRCRSHQSDQQEGRTGEQAAQQRPRKKRSSRDQTSMLQCTPRPETRQLFGRLGKGSL